MARPGSFYTGTSFLKYQLIVKPVPEESIYSHFSPGKVAVKQKALRPSN